MEVHRDKCSENVSKRSKTNNGMSCYSGGTLKFMKAAKEGAFSLLKLHIDGGTDVNYRNSKGRNAFLESSCNGHI